MFIQIFKLEWNLLSALATHTHKKRVSRRRLQHTDNPDNMFNRIHKKNQIHSLAGVHRVEFLQQSIAGFSQPILIRLPLDNQKGTNSQ